MFSITFCLATRPTNSLYHCIVILFFPMVVCIISEGENDYDQGFGQLNKTDLTLKVLNC